MVIGTKTRYVLPDITVFEISGRLHLGNNLLSIETALRKIVGEGGRKLVIDVAALDYVDSSGIGMMAATLKEVRTHGGDLRLLRLNTHGQRLFSVLKLKTTFEIFDDEAVALRSFEFRPHG